MSAWVRVSRRGCDPYCYSCSPDIDLLSSAVTIVPAGQTHSHLWTEPVDSTAYDLAAPAPSRPNATARRPANGNNRKPPINYESLPTPTPTFANSSSTRSAI